MSTHAHSDARPDSLSGSPVDGNRRRFLAAAASAALLLPQTPAAAAQTTQPEPRRRTNRIAVSTYSYWRFRPDSKLSIEQCIDLAAETGFDAVEILHIQMEDESNSALQRIKQRAFAQGLDLCGFSTHQSFVSPDPDVRTRNVEHTLKCIELAYALGIPTIRVNTGRWGTVQSFNELMANKGIEPRLEGYSDEDGFGWVIEGLTRCLKKAEQCGVVLGLENHWGLGREARGVLHILRQIDSPWLKATLDTGNFLENQYEQYAALAPEAVLVQAKTYYGGGTWYTLEIDYQRVAEILRRANYRGYISLEFEGQADHATAIPQSLDLLRQAFAG